MTAVDTCTDARVLQPISSVPRTVALTSVALVTPLFAVLYFLTVPGGTWPTLLLEHALVTLACTIATIRLCRARVWVAGRGIVMRSPLGLRRKLDRDDIGQLLLVQTYRGQTLDTQPHLFVVTADGRTGMRLRGSMWSRESMRRLAQELDIPLTSIHEAMTRGELRRSHPHLLPWLERRRVSLAIATVGAAALGALAAAALLGAHGLPGAVPL
ncbi:hypothetical protein ACFDTO_00320 [Microbacteriaceae bacterium 4G12]